MHRMIWELQQISRPTAADRGALAALRRGLSVPPGEYVPMFPYVLSWLTEEEVETHFNTYCLLASLYANHPKSTTRGNLGTHLYQTMGGGASKPMVQATERRFMLLLRAHAQDLPQYLARTIAYLAAKDEPVNWEQLLADLLCWEYDPERVRKEWARGFWKHRSQQEADATLAQDDATVEPDSTTHQDDEDESED